MDIGTIFQAFDEMLRRYEFRSLEISDTEAWESLFDCSCSELKEYFDSCSLINNEGCKYYWRKFPNGFLVCVHLEVNMDVMPDMCQYGMRVAIIHIPTAKLLSYLTAGIYQPDVPLYSDQMSSFFKMNFETLLSKFEQHERAELSDAELYLKKNVWEKYKSSLLSYYSARIEQDFIPWLKQNLNINALFHLIFDNRNLEENVYNPHQYSLQDIAFLLQSGHFQIAQSVLRARLAHDTDQARGLKLSTDWIEAERRNHKFVDEFFAKRVEEYVTSGANSKLNNSRDC